MALIQNLIPLGKYDIKCPYYMNPKGICIHNTANDAPAINERNYMASNNNEVSFHIAVDDVEAIQCIPFNRNAWASGDGGVGEGNRNYIHLEICYSKSGGDRFINSEKRAAKEVATLLKQYNWTISNVKKHQDFSNKYCPHRTLDMGWQRFLNMIQAELNVANINKAPSNDKEIYRVRKNWGDVASQIGAFSNLDNAKKSCQTGYSVFNTKGEKVYSIEKVVEVINSKKYLNLKPHVPSWRVYPTNLAPVIANACGSLAPKTYGGLSYEILANPQTDVYTIQTQSFGKVNIYAPRDNDSSITEKTIY